MGFEMNFDPNAPVGSFEIFTSPPYARSSGFRIKLNGRIDGYYLVKESHAVVRIFSRCFPPETQEGTWWYVEDVLHPEAEMTRCRDDLLERELNEMEVLAWASK